MVSERSIGAFLALTVAGCGGMVVFEEESPAAGAGGTSASSSGADVTSGPGGGGQTVTSTGSTGEGGSAPECSPLHADCDLFCALCDAGPEPGGCLASCLAFHVASYPLCSDAYAAEVSCLAQAAQGTAGCEGAITACDPAIEAFVQCIEENPDCNGYACSGCSCQGRCGNDLSVDCDPASSTCACVVDGERLGDCIGVCGVDAMACCDDLVAPDCPYF